MGRLFDFQCDTCDRVEERLIDGDEREFPCAHGACGGTLYRKIGGGPVPRGAGRARFPGLTRVAHVHVGPVCLDVFTPTPTPKAKA